MFVTNGKSRRLYVLKMNFTSNLNRFNYKLKEGSRIYRYQFILTIIITFALLLLIISSASCTRSATVTPPAKNSPPVLTYYYKALSFLETSEFDSALAQLDTAISRRPEFAQFYYAKGQIFELIDQPDSAISNYEKSITFKSHFPQVWKNLSTLYFETGQYQKAVQILKDIVEQEPDSLRYLLMLADAYLHADRARLALDKIWYYEVQGGQSPEEDRIKGLAYYQQREFEKAVRYLKIYAHRNSANFKVQKAVGIVCIKTGELEEGISHLNTALQMNPRDPEIYLYRSEYFIQRNKLPMAHDQLELAYNMDSSNVDILLGLGKFYLLTGDALQAGPYFRKAIRTDSTCWESYKYLGIMADEAGRSGEALRYLEKYRNHIYSRDPMVEQRIGRLRKTKNKKT